MVRTRVSAITSMFPTRTCFDTLELICALWQSERFLCLVRGRKQNSTEEADHCICHHISSMKGRPADCVMHVRECARERGVGGGVYCILPSFLFFMRFFTVETMHHDHTTALLTCLDNRVLSTLQCSVHGRTQLLCEISVTRFIDKHYG